MSAAGDRRVTTVVITRNRLLDLRRTLPNHQPPVILVDNGSTDGTLDYVAHHFPWIRVVALAGNLGACARNVGVRAARTPYVAFSDDDSWWEPGALSLAADVFDRSPRLAVLAADVVLDECGRRDPIAGVMAAAPLGRSSDLPGPEVLGFLACGAVVRREPFLNAGGFDRVVFFGGEEERLALDLRSAGWGLSFVPQVVAHHRPSGTRNDRNRAIRGHRNRVLTALMRRPWPVVARTVGTAARSGPEGRAGLRRAVWRAPAALAHRRALPPDVELARRRLDPPIAPAPGTRASTATGPERAGDR